MMAIMQRVTILFAFLTFIHSSSAAVTAGPGCQYFYGTRPGQFFLGQHTMSNNIATDSRCKAVCSADTTCVAVSYSVPNKFCYSFHTEADIQLSSRIDGVDSYIKGVQCTPTTPTTTTTTTTTTTKAPTTTTKTPAPTTTTKATTTTVKPTVAPNCIYNYTKEPNKYIMDGDRQKEYTTKSHCEKFCTQDYACVAYNFGAANECYHIKNKKSLTTAAIIPNTNPPMNLYVKQEHCTDRCTNPWMINDGKFATSIPGKSPPPVQLPLAACQTLCFNTANCVGVSYSSIATLGCYKIIETSQLSFLEARPEYTTYIKKTDCISTTPSVQTTTPPTKYCKYPFLHTRNKFLMGGKDFANDTTLDDCQKHCLETRCTAFHWASHVIPKCYLHYGQVNTNKLVLQANIDFYQHKPGCVPEPPQTTPNQAAQKNTMSITLMMCPMLTITWLSSFMSHRL